MFIPYFNTEDNYSKLREDIRTANGYCFNCNKPLAYRKRLYCGRCTYRLFRTGLEDKRVTIGKVGKDTTNYQQFLHTSIFKCNAHINYRGNKQDRIKARVTDEAINVATIRLRRSLSCNKFTYNEKEYNNNQHNRNIYLAVANTRNIDKRLIYNTLLYYISYFINNNQQFKTEVHFQTSMLNNLLINVENTYKRLNPEVNIKRFHMLRCDRRGKYWYWLLKEVNSIIQPLMNEIALSINKKQ